MPSSGWRTFIASSRCAPRRLIKRRQSTVVMATQDVCSQRRESDRLVLIHAPRESLHEQHLRCRKKTGGDMVLPRLASATVTELMCPAFHGESLPPIGCDRNPALTRRDASNGGTRESERVAAIRLDPDRHPVQKVERDDSSFLSRALRNKAIPLKRRATDPRARAVNKQAVADSRRLGELPESNPLHNVG